MVRLSHPMMLRLPRTYDSPSATHDSPPATHDSPFANYDSPSATYDSPSVTYDSPSTIYDSASATHYSPSASYYSSPASNDSPSPLVSNVIACKLSFSTNCLTLCNQWFPPASNVSTPSPPVSPSATHGFLQHPMSHLLQPTVNL
jgi:hypothetical protein